MVRKLIEKYKETTDLNRFLIKGTILFMAWRVFRKWMILEGQNGWITQHFSILYLKVSHFFLALFGTDVTVSFVDRKMWVTGSNNAVEIVYDCLGVNLFFVFLIFIIAYPGSNKVRLWFIPMGIVVIFLLNAMRMAILTRVVANNPEMMNFLHNFVFQGFIYISIFAMWFWFTKTTDKKKV
jgi:exosortase/archaeosortase family protein